MIVWCERAIWYVNQSSVPDSRTSHQQGTRDATTLMALSSHLGSAGSIRPIAC